MPMTLDETRAELARYLAENAGTRYSLDKALAHVVTQAYQRGLAEGLKCEDEIQRARAVQLARDILDPEMYGHAVSEEVRQAARRVLR